MVLSQLHTSVQYREDKDLCDEDVDMDTTLYSMFFPNMRLKLTIGTGKPRYTMKKDGIVFFPIYLIHEDQFVMQIGVYEIFSNELPTLVDEDNNIDISLMRRDPVMYSFANQESLKEYGEYTDDVGEEGLGGVEVESGSDDDADEGEGEGSDEDEGEGSDEGEGEGMRMRMTAMYPILNRFRPFRVTQSVTCAHSGEQSTWPHLWTNLTINQSRLSQPRPVRTPPRKRARTSRSSRPRG